MITPLTVSSPSPSTSPSPSLNPAPRRIFIIEDDPLMAECVARALPPCDAQIFSDAISATNALAGGLPDLVLLDVLLNGPDGFTFLNEMISYSDTAKIPVIIVTSLRLAEQNLAHYGVRAVLNKDTMTPADIRSAAETALAARNPEAQRHPEAARNPSAPQQPTIAAPTTTNPEKPHHAC